MEATEKKVYVLYEDKSIEILNADDISQSILKINRLNNLGVSKGDFTSLSVINSKNEVWLGDSKGFIHILDSNSLEIKSEG